MHNTELHQIREQFVNYFCNHGYIQEPSVKISSNTDPTTIFIGSGISTLKKYILSEIPTAGVIVDQPSMRFRELKKLFDPSYNSHYGAFFNSMNLITPSQDVGALCEQLYNYFTENISIPEQNLLARVSSKDKELLKIARKQFKNMEIDTRPDSYYRHVVGIDGYKGINFNIAVKHKYTGEFEDTGNLLLFEKNGEHAFLEIGLGDTVIQKPLMGYDHVLDCYQVESPETLNKIERLNYINSIIVSSVLYREGLKPSNKNNQNRILQKYIKYLSLLKSKNLVTYENIGDSVSSFETQYYKDDKTIKEDILLTLNEKEDTFKIYLKDAGLLTH